MYTDQDEVEVDKDVIFEYWARFHEEPTMYHPPDLVATRVELSEMTAHVRRLEYGQQGGNALAVARFLRELTSWRLFPFYALPDDILLHIFRQGTFYGPDNPYGPTMPLIYSSVCKRWRKLALDASWLWGIIVFCDTTPSTLTELYLERSKSAPLIIDIDVTNNKFDWEDDTFWVTADFMAERLSLLLPHIHRWKMFSCYTDNWAPIQTVLSMLQNLAAPMLKSFELKMGFEITVPAEVSTSGPITLLGRGAPALRELVLDTVSIDWHNLSFSNLSELELCRLREGTFPPVHDFWAMLRNSPNLRRLALSEAGPVWDEDATFQLPRVELLYLEHLELDGNGCRGPHTLAYLTFVSSMFFTGPILHKLLIGGLAPEDDLLQAWPLLSNFPYITELMLADIHFTTKTATQWLTAFPNVHRISFMTGRQTQSAVLEALADPSQPRGRLCPSLVTIAFSDVDFEATSAVLLNRHRLHLPIRKLVFDINHKAETLALNSLRNVVEFGFEGALKQEDSEWVGPDAQDYLSLPEVAIPTAP